MKTVVMTGATSFLGRNLLDGLIQEGYEIYAAVRMNSLTLQMLPNSNYLHLIYADLEHLDDLCEYVTKADIFIHFAWDGSGYVGRADSQIQSKNVKHSLTALKLAHKLQCESFVFSGSQAEYGIRQNVMHEAMTCEPVSAYGKAKLAFSQQAQAYCNNYGIKFIHLRIFSVYGYGDRKGTLVDACLHKFNHGGMMQLGACTQFWNYLYISDFVCLVLRLLEKDCTAGTYNVASSETRKLKEFVQELYNSSNKRGCFQFGEETLNPEGSQSIRPAIEKIEKAIGPYGFVPFKEGIRKIMDQMIIKGEL